MLSHRIHRGLIKASGYVDSDEAEPGDWLYKGYIQKSNKDFDYRRLGAQAHAYLESKRQNARISLPDGRPIDAHPMEENEEELGEGEKATVQLDSGEVVELFRRQQELYKLVNQRAKMKVMLSTRRCRKKFKQMEHRGHLGE